MFADKFHPGWARRPARHRGPSPGPPGADTDQRPGPAAQTAARPPAASHYALLRGQKGKNNSEVFSISCRLVGLWPYIHIVMDDLQSVCAFCFLWQPGTKWEWPWVSLGTVVLQLIKFDLSGSTLGLSENQGWLWLRWVATVGNIIGNSWPTGQLSAEPEKSKHKAPKLSYNHITEPASTLATRTRHGSQ